VEVGVLLKHVVKHLLKHMLGHLMKQNPSKCSSQ
jgi:hypothetical protein